MSLCILFHHVSTMTMRVSVLVTIMMTVTAIDAIVIYYSNTVISVILIVLMLIIPTCNSLKYLKRDSSIPGTSTQPLHC